MRINVPFGYQAYESVSLPVNAQELVGFYTEAQPQDSKSKLIVIPTPGASTEYTVGTGPIWGMKVLNDVLYVVSGTELYSVSRGTSTLLGTISGNKRCSMAHNSVELCIVNGTKGYLYDTTNGFREITDESFYPTDVVGYLERRFIFPRKGTRQFFCSNAFNGFTYNALNFDQVLVDPENITSMIVDHGEIWLFTNKGAEVWVYNRDESSFPYSRIDAAKIEKGTLSAYSPAKIDNTIFWLGHDRIIYKADGYKPTRISTHAIEHKIKKYDTISDAFGLTYEFGGHLFYEITFPSEKETWRYDTSTGFWHKPNEMRYIANASETFEGKLLIGDYRNGNIYSLHEDIYTEPDTTHRIASTPQIHSGRSLATMDRLFIDIEAGVGVTTGQGSDPQLMLKYSKDGGKTWSSEKWKTLGAVGKYSQTLKYENFGSFRQIMFKFEVSDPVKVVIVDAYADVEADDSY